MCIVRVIPTKYMNTTTNADFGSLLLAQLTALCDQQSALLTCPDFSRTLSHGCDLAGRSLADLFAGSLAVTDRKEPAHYTSSEHAKKVFCESTKTTKNNHNNTSVPIFGSGILKLTVSYEYRHEVGAAGASLLTSRTSSSSRRGQKRLGCVACN